MILFLSGIGVRAPSVAESNEARVDIIISLPTATEKISSGMAAITPATQVIAIKKTDLRNLLFILILNPVLILFFNFTLLFYIILFIVYLSNICHTGTVIPDNNQTRNSLLIFNFAYYKLVIAQDFIYIIL